MTIDDSIHKTFPTGLLHEPATDESRMKQAERDVHAIADTLSSLIALRISHQLRYGDDRYFAFAATLAPAPTQNDWLWHYDNPAKLAYIAQAGASLPIWWVQFSFVYPVWRHYFNLWTPRPADPSYLDANWTEDTPTTEWATTVSIAERVVESYGFTRMDLAAIRREVPFVCYQVFSDDDDDDEPRLETCSVGQCLFSEC